jgi:DNA-binding transcriptional LysR family regulator
MTRGPFRLHHIAVLHAVASSQTMTEAARRLNVSQPAVSKQLKQLQQDLGFALFERQGHRLLPTFEARALLDQLSRVNASLNVLNRLAGDFRTARRGHIQVGCIQAAALHLLPEALQHAIGADAQVLCSVHTGNTAQVLEWIETQQVDIGIAMKVRDASRWGYSALLPLRLECLMSKDHPLAARRTISPKHLAPHPVVAIDVPAMVWTGAQSAAWDGVLASIRIRTDSAQVACRMAEAGLGVAVLDSLTAASSGVRHGLVRRVLKHPYEAEVGIYRPSFRPRSGLAQGLMHALHRQAETLG